MAASPPSNLLSSDRGPEDRFARADLLQVSLALLLPPLSIFRRKGLGPSFWTNVMLTFCGYVPGLLHALYTIVRK